MCSLAVISSDVSLLSAGLVNAQPQHRQQHNTERMGFTYLWDTNVERGGKWLCPEAHWVGDGCARPCRLAVDGMV